MKVLFVNNTKKLENIGCQMTSVGLEILLKDYDPTSFFAGDIFGINQKLRSKMMFKLLCIFPNLFSKFILLFIKNFILKNEKPLVSLIDNSDLILINGEGTIHHNKITGLVLVAIASISKDMGRVVHLVNSTLQSLSSSQIIEIKRIDKVVVREFYSQKLLSKYKINSILSADAAWIFLQKKFPDLMLSAALNYKKDLPTVITLGVSPNYQKIIKKIQTSCIANNNLVYLYVDKSDTNNINFLKKFLNISNIIDGGKVILDPSIISSNYKHMITGRHHIAILSYFLGIPTTIFSSNTYKIESTIFSIKGSHIKKEIVLSKEEIQKTVELARLNFLI